MQDKEQKWTRNPLDSHFNFKNDQAQNIDDDSTKAQISEFIIHPDWDPKDSHYNADIAIAVLEKPIKLSLEIRHVCLNTPSNPIQSLAGRSGTVYGWGLTEDLEEDLAPVSQLRHVDEPLVDHALCNSSSPMLRKIMSDTSFCAGVRDGQTGPCNGKI